MKKLLLVLIVIGFIGCDLIKRNHQNIEWSSIRANITKICIEGHIYYVKETTYSVSLALKVDDNGKPIKCEKEK